MRRPRSAAAATALALAAISTIAPPALAAASTQNRSAVAPTHAPAAAASPSNVPTKASARDHRIWPQAGAPAPSIPTIRWHACDEPSQRKLGLQCATAPVPLDYANPRGPKILLDLSRHRAPGKRTGSLFVNPGGPGGSPTDHMGEFLGVLGKPVSSRFDIVAMEPRGVGVDSQAQCWSLHHEPAQASTYPRTTHDIRVTIAHDAFERAACATSGRPIIDHMSTGDVARDMDVMRQAVGDKQLTYYGVSYGTVLASTYAAMFPSKVRAIIEDGVVDPVAWTSGHGREAATTPVSARSNGGPGADETLRAAFAACKKAGPKRCPHGATIAGEWDAMVNALKKHDAPTPYGPMSLSDLLSNTLTSLYDPTTIAAAMQWIHDDYLLVTKKATHRTTGRPAASAPTLGTPGGGVITPTKPQPDASQWFDTFKMAGVMCSDSVNPSDPMAWARYATKAEKTSWFAPVWGWNSSLCAGWPGHDFGVYRGPFDVKPAHPLLIVGNTHDPATPLSSAQATARLIPSTRLMTVDAFGHTASAKSRGALTAMQQYLLTGALPKPGAHFAADKPLF